jgi:hypothetical protein
MQMAIKEYERTKDVLVIGEIKDGIPIDDPELAKKARAKAKREKKAQEDLEINLDEAVDDDLD